MADRPVSSPAQTTTKLRAYLTLAALGTLAGLVFARPELVALTAPLAVYAALGVSAARRVPHVTIEGSPPAGRVLEGERFTVEVIIATTTPVEQLDFEFAPAPGIRADADHRPGWRSRRGGSLRVITRLNAGERRTLRFDLRSERWGAPRPGVLSGYARDRFGVVQRKLGPVSPPPVRVLPLAETLRQLIDPRELQATSGSRVARDRGEGIEFAEARPFHYGDAVRRINWRITARRGALYVSDRHPERNGDVILFLDTFSDIGDEHDTTLAVAVRAAAALAAGYLDRKDRVGVVGFGGTLSGVGPRLGINQLYRIVDTLLHSQVNVSYAAKDVRYVPRRLLPPKALVVAISPLIDERSITALFDLARRGYDLAILEISPEPFIAARRTREDTLGRRLWRLRRDAVRAQLQTLGVSVIEWDGSGPLQLPLAAATQARRHATHRARV